jgi:hypothetical protein
VTNTQAGSPRSKPSRFRGRRAARLTCRGGGSPSLPGFGSATADHRAVHFCAFTNNPLGPQCQGPAQERHRSGPATTPPPFGGPGEASDKAAAAAVSRRQSRIAGTRLISRSSGGPDYELPVSSAQACITTSGGLSGAGPATRPVRRVSHGTAGRPPDARLPGRARLALLRRVHKRRVGDRPVRSRRRY